eukprot:6026088-Pyramimonas_sp.AAC.1
MPAGALGHGEANKANLRASAEGRVKHLRYLMPLESDPRMCSDAALTSSTWLALSRPRCFASAGLRASWSRTLQRPWAL